MHDVLTLCVLMSSESLNLGELQAEVEDLKVQLAQDRVNMAWLFVHREIFAGISHGQKASFQNE